MDIIKVAAESLLYFPLRQLILNISHRKSVMTMLLIKWFKVQNLPCSKFKVWAQSSTYGSPQDDSSSWLYELYVSTLGNWTSSFSNNHRILSIVRTKYFEPFSVNLLSPTRSLTVRKWSSLLLKTSITFAIAHWFCMVLVFRSSISPVLKFLLIFCHLALLCRVAKTVFYYRYQNLSPICWILVLSQQLYKSGYL